MSLYRKYRPLDFDSLLGQDHIREILKSAIEQKRISHAYLFTGPRGTGKTSTARILARAINCEHTKAGNPCNTCELCRAGLEERLTDLIEIDAASHGSVDDARVLVEQARFLPVQAKKKVYLIDEVHMLSKSAFNALLKIIEEPPEHVHFILATTESHKVLDTIRSRCQRFDFHLADDRLVAAHLSQVCQWEGVSPEEQAIDLLALHARGSFRDGLSLLAQVIGMGPFTAAQVREVLGLSANAAIVQFVESLRQSDADTALKVVHLVHEQGGDLFQFCQSILENLRASLLKPHEAGERSRILPWMDIFFEALNALRDPMIPELPLEIAVLKCMEHDPHIRMEPNDPNKNEHDPNTLIRQNDPNVRQTKVESKTELETSNQKPVTSSPFDLSAFLAAIENPSLRRTLKSSRLELKGNQLHIAASSDMALSQIKQRVHFDHLLSVIESQIGKDVMVDFSVEKLEAKEKMTLKADEVRSVFT